MSVSTQDPVAMLRRAVLATVTSDARDLTLRQLGVLLVLHKQQSPAPSVKDLAAELNLSKPAITRALDTLELERGLAIRKPHHEDRRMLCAVITEAGLEYIDVLRAGAQSPE